jgi:hypothetical protein
MSTPQWPQSSGSGSGDERPGPYETQRPEATQPGPYQQPGTPPGGMPGPEMTQPIQPQGVPPGQPAPEPFYHPGAPQPTQYYPPPGQPPEQWGGVGVQAPPEGPAKTRFGPVMLALGIGSLVSVAVGVYAGLHKGTGFAFNVGLFSSGLSAKSWLASLVFLLVIVQLVSSLMIFGKLPGGGPVVGALHRWSGRIAVVVSLPVAAHCLYAFGFYYGDTRVLVHSLLGCLVYGVFVCKMLVLSRDDSPKWALPLFGGLLFTVFSGLWLTSSLWFFTSSGLVF